MRYPMEALERGCRRAQPSAAAHHQRRAIGSAGERLVHTEEVTGSIPVSPTRSEARSGAPLTALILRKEGELSPHWEPFGKSFLGPSLAPARNSATASYSGLRPGAARTCANRSSSSPRGSTDERPRAVARSLGPPPVRRAGGASGLTASAVWPV